MVLRSGGKTRQGPGARSAARVSTTIAAGALAAAWRLPSRVRHAATCRPLGFSEKVTQERQTLVENGLVVVVRMIEGNGVSVQARSKMHLTGWQNTWEQAPGVPATPSPP